MVTDAIGLYVHIPFCKAKCNYCDFCSSARGVGDYERYTDALITQIQSYKREPKINVGTVFFGGGTPSLLPVRLMKKIVSAIKESFLILPGAELTLESNPGTLTPESLLAYREMGFNRISIGVQSIHENELKILGRIHSGEDATAAIRLARSAGFININADLMYGIPEQTVSSFEKTLDRVIAAEPTHISCYGLMLEEGTPLYAKRDSLVFPTEDEECLMYELAAEKLSLSGFEHYEISNYAKSGFYCFHNLVYWHMDEYIGLGLAAHSFFGEKRYSSTESFSEYLQDPCVKYVLDEDPEPAFEYAMLRLRLKEGISLAEYESLFGVPFGEGREDKIESYKRLGYLTLSDGRLSLTERGFYVSNTILSELL